MYHCTCLCAASLKIKDTALVHSGNLKASWKGLLLRNPPVKNLLGIEINSHNTHKSSGGVKAEIPFSMFMLHMNS